MTALVQSDMECTFPFTGAKASYPWNSYISCGRERKKTSSVCLNKSLSFGTVSTYTDHCISYCSRGDHCCFFHPYILDSGIFSLDDACYLFIDSTSPGGDAGLGPQLQFHRIFLLSLVASEPVFTKKKWNPGIVESLDISWGRIFRYLVDSN